MQSFTFHINLYDMAFLGAIFIGLTFVTLLLFTRSDNRIANRYLALAWLIMIFWMIRIVAIDAGLRYWDRLPTLILLALGPLIYLYVLKITRPPYTFRRKDLFHFSPLVVALPATDPVMQVLVFISMMAYLYYANRLIQTFYRRLPPVLMDRPLVEFRWLRRLLAATAVLWCLWMVCYVVYRLAPNHPFYILFAVMIIWTAAAAFLNPRSGTIIQMQSSVRPPIPAGLRAKAAWLKKAMDANRYFEEPELSLSMLSEKLHLPHHELSRLINTVFKKSFNDFVNEYRVRDVICKMKDPAFNNMTLLGIAMDAG